MIAAVLAKPQPKTVCAPKVTAIATVRAHIHVPLSDVYAVLANGWTYTPWVVGASHMRAVDPDRRSSPERPVNGRPR